MGREGMRIRYGWERQKGSDHWEDRDVDGWTILGWICGEIKSDGVDWIDVAQDRDQWRTLVNTILNLLVP
jgi:hypothetical protein